MTRGEIKLKGFSSYYNSFERYISDLCAFQDVHAHRFVKAARQSQTHWVHKELLRTVWKYKRARSRDQILSLMADSVKVWEMRRAFATDVHLL